MMPRSISLMVLTGLIACLGLAFWQVMRPFLLTLLLAAVLAMLLQPILRYVLSKIGDHRQVAAAITTVGTLGSVLLPMLIGIILGATQLASWSSDFYSSPKSREVLERIYNEMQIGKVVHRIQPYFDRSTKPEEWEKVVTEKVEQNLPKLLEAVSSKTMGLAASTFGLVGLLIEFGVTMGIFVIALYFFLADGPMMLSISRELLPLDQAHQERLLDQFARTTRAVVTGTFAAAVAQALAVGVGLYFAGIERAILLTVVAGIVAIVPIAGTTLVWVPCAIWLWHAQESSYPVIFFVLYNLIVVSGVDNLVRAYVLNSDVKLHPLIAFVSVMGGLQWVGIWGVFVGPVLASCLYALLRIFKEELLIYGKEAPADTAVAVVPAVVAQTAVVVAAAPAKPTPLANPPVKKMRKSANKRR
ncbi:MAG: putative inner rane protein [Planctomycetaceae bacterium]|nr:putative inner rane protein [Planctomycetaceae bacterium]